MTVLKGIVRGHLREKQFEQALDLLKSEPRLVRTVLSLLYDGDDLTRWRAVTMVGKIAEVEPGKVQPLIRRFIWWMNDEAGGIGWSSAPALAEIGRKAPELLKDAVRVVVFWRAERILLQSVLWAVGRLSPAYPSVVAEAVPDLIGYLGDGAEGIRGTAAWALGQIGDESARSPLEALRGDDGTVRIYDAEEIEDWKIGNLAAAAAQRLAS